MVWVYIYSSICFVIYGKVAQWWVGGYEGLFGLGFESCALQVKIWIFFIWVFTGQPQKIGDFLLKNWCLNSKTGVFFFHSFIGFLAETDILPRYWRNTPIFFLEISPFWHFATLFCFHDHWNAIFQQNFAESFGNFHSWLWYYCLGNPSFLYLKKLFLSLITKSLDFFNVKFVT